VICERSLASSHKLGVVCVVVLPFVDGYGVYPAECFPTTISRFKVQNSKEYSISNDNIYTPPSRNNKKEEECVAN
jgi:hypothetical protein